MSRKGVLKIMANNLKLNRVKRLIEISPACWKQRSDSPREEKAPIHPSKHFDSISRLGLRQFACDLLALKIVVY